MDFYTITVRRTKKGVPELAPEFKVIRSKDLMTRGRSFYAIWDEERGLWSTNEYDVQRIIDADLRNQYDILQNNEPEMQVRWMSNYNSQSWRNYVNYIRSLPDNYHQLDDNLIFSNSQVKKEDYASKKLPYPLQDGAIAAYDELMSTLYDKDERQKLEWAIGAVVSGESKHIQKFEVLYGDAGSGKSTVLNIIQKLFAGYYATFEAKELVGTRNSFSTEVFRNNPLVAIQHDGDLSRIEDNTKLNSIVSHEEMIINEKFKASYTGRINAFLFMATNQPVKISDAKSGIIRRLIDIHPSGKRIPFQRYSSLMSQIDFELGAIAYHCLQVYRSIGESYYDSYRPYEMMYKTDIFFNFVEENYLLFDKQDGCSFRQAWDLYKTYISESGSQYQLPMYRFREELKNYFYKYDSGQHRMPDGSRVRGYYSEFRRDKFEETKQIDILDEIGEAGVQPLKLECTESLLDDICKDCKAQYATENGTPFSAWDSVKTVLSDLDTSKMHYILLPENHIVIDFDLRGEDGEKDISRNLLAAAGWPLTYAELSKSGAGVHLHYIYDGDPKELSRIYSEGIEIKVFTGNSSLRRRLTRCNDIPVAHISSGLPLKEVKMVNYSSIKSEKSLRKLLERNLNKEIHPGTKPSIDFIKKILDEAYEDGLHYDVSDMRPRITNFAANSTHQADYCLKQVLQMHFKSDAASADTTGYSEDRLMFFDVEVFPNLFLLNWKYENADTCVRMVNPSPQEIERLFSYRLVGFNCRRYDNHIVYARYLGYNNQQLYDLSQRIVSGQTKNTFFSEAYNLSYTDVYDFASAGNKKSLKKFEIELDITHKELGLPWDEPVPESRWNEVAEYCDNDVIATEAVFHHLSGDWAARQILAELSGLSVNDTTNQHTTRIIFGKNRHPQLEFEYPNLANTFPGYSYDHGKASYRGEDPGRGGYVYSEPGMYRNVALLDIASMHPTSIEVMNLFGPYTKRFSDIKNARIYIKHGEYDRLNDILDGKLVPFVQSIQDGTSAYTADDLSNALKTVINSVYGLTSASFENPFRDPRNSENIVAKRGALFMIDLKNACQEKGWTVVHIKTDSIKLADATDEMVSFVMEFGRKYGYSFEHESTYDKMCIVNESVYIAHVASGKHEGTWFATGAQFQHPYVYKTLFSKEPLIFSDYCETKSVSTSMSLDLNERLPDVKIFEREQQERAKGEKGKRNPELSEMSDADILKEIEKGHYYQFIGKVGSFCPVKDGFGGGILCRKSDKGYSAVTGTKGYRWLESDVVRASGDTEIIDTRYFRHLVDDAIDNISKYGDFEWFVSEIDICQLDECIQLKAGAEKQDCEHCDRMKVCEVLPF